MTEQKRREQRLRSRAATRGYTVLKNRNHDFDNQGLYMVVTFGRSTCVLGECFDATLEDIEAFLADKAPQKIGRRRYSVSTTASRER